MVILSVTLIASPPTPWSGVVVDVLDGTGGVDDEDATNSAVVLVISPEVSGVDDSGFESSPLHPTSAITSEIATRRLTVATPLPDRSPTRW
jgi:hypothetical protein